MCQMKLQFFDILYATLQTRSQTKLAKEKEKVERKKMEKVLMISQFWCQNVKKENWTDLITVSKL